jgi:YesN/AraC family two-component response regulator
MGSGANDGVDGLVAVRSERPNLVMSDILMPTMDCVGYRDVVARVGPDQFAWHER